MRIIKTHGRKIIKVNYTEADLLDAKTEQKQNEMIIDIIQSTKATHEYNRLCCEYLRNYYKGVQDIEQKIKHTRTEINNKTVENWCFAMVDFKIAQLLGKAIQYVQVNDASEEEIATLNKYVKLANKKTKDEDLYEDILVCGRGFRYTNFRPKNKYDYENENAPFELLNLDPEHTEIVYSNVLGNEPILAYVQTDMEFADTNIDPKTGQANKTPQKYNEYTVYLRNRKVVLSDKTGKLEIDSKQNSNIALGDHVVTEYYINRHRLSLIEIGKDLFDDINYLESLDKDDMEQFVNAIMVFKNADIDEEDFDAMNELGAICISSTENREAGVELLQQRLKASDTQVYYTRLLTALHQVLAVPMATDNGSVTSGDTGRAKLVGQGFGYSDIRNSRPETMFGMCDMNSLKKILKICRETTDSKISNLKSTDIENRFMVDRNENLLVKTQALLNLYDADIPREFANAIIGLFGDPNAITKKQEELFGAQKSKQGSQETNMENAKNGENDISGENNNIASQDKAQAQNNEMKATLQNENQGK